MVDCVWRSDNAAEIKFETSALTSTEISGMTKHVCCRWDFHRVDTPTCFCKSPLPGNFSDPLCSIKGCLPIFLPLLSSCIKEEMWLCWKQRSHFLKALLVVWITPTSATFAFVLGVAVIKPAKRKTHFHLSYCLSYDFHQIQQSRFLCQQGAKTPEHRQKNYSVITHEPSWDMPGEEKPMKWYYLLQNDCFIGFTINFPACLFFESCVFKLLCFSYLTCLVIVLSPFCGALWSLPTLIEK